MPFSDYDDSHQAGETIELYTFTRGAVVIARHTSADRRYTVGGFDFDPFPGGMKRGKIGLTVERSRNAMRIVVARSHTVATYMRQRPRTGVIGVSVQAFQRSDPSDVMPIFAGRVLNSKRAGLDHRELLCESRAVSMERTGLRSLCQPNCPHVLYGTKCRLDPAPWTTATTIAGISGRTLTVDDFDAATDYGGGYAKYTDDAGIIEYAFILRGVGAVLTLDLPFYGAAVSDAVEITAGCDHTIATCAIKDNDENYGGRKDLPTKNPFLSNVFL
jgi:uncharacterized phage protein (TIGR02218 family)